MTISIAQEYAPAGPGAGTDVVITLTDAQENDVVLVFGGHGIGEATIDTPAGWTDVAEILTGAPFVKCFWKAMGSSPDASVTCDGGGNAGDGVAYIGYLIRGADTTSPIDVSATTAAGGPNFPDAPSITPVTVGSYVFAFGAGDTIDSSITAPTGYSTALNAIGNGTTNDISVGGSYKAWSGSGAEDPAAYTAWGCTNWNAMTVAVRPASESGIVMVRDLVRDIARDTVRNISG